jgi:hypothetical protein
VLELCTGGSLQDSFKHHGDAFEMVSGHTCCMHLCTAAALVAWTNWHLHLMLLWGAGCARMHAHVCIDTENASSVCKKGLLDEPCWARSRTVGMVCTLQCARPQDVRRGVYTPTRQLPQ